MDIIKKKESPLPFLSIAPNAPRAVRAVALLLFLLGMFLVLNPTYLALIHPETPQSIFATIIFIIIGALYLFLSLAIAKLAKSALWFFGVIVLLGVLNGIANPGTHDFPYIGVILLAILLYHYRFFKTQIV